MPHSGSQIQQNRQYRQLLLAVWYTIFHTYFISVYLRSKSMALNLFIYGTAIAKPKSYHSSSQLYAPSEVTKNVLLRAECCRDPSSCDVKLSASVESSQCSGEQNNDSLDQSDAVETYGPSFFLPSINVQECSQSKEVSPLCNSNQEESCWTADRSLSCSDAFESSKHSSVRSIQSETLCVGSDVQLKQQNADTSITPCDLVRLINNSEACLLLDCRTFMAFNANHIMGALNVSCSDRITRKRLLDGKINVGDVISGQEGKALYRSLEAEAEIVVYDENTTELCALAATHPLRLLTDCLHKHGKQSRFLLGGLEAFKKSYGCMCSEPDADGCVPLLFSPTSPEVNCDIDTAVASEILPFLLIGNHRDASNRELLKELKVTHVLNVTAQLPLHFESDGITCKILAASDSGSQNLKQYFAEAIEFIDKAREVNGRVLVHCQAGVSRSPTIVIAYLMARNQQNLSDAFSFVKDRRSIVAPNLNFMGQLLEFDQQSVQRSGLCPPVEPVHLLRM